jgi:hypothetical protein
VVASPSSPVWRQVDHPARGVPLPLDLLERIADFAIAPDHTIYATYVPPTRPRTQDAAAVQAHRRGAGPLDGASHRRDLQRPAPHRPRQRPVRGRRLRRRHRLDPADHPGRAGAPTGRPAPADQPIPALPGGLRLTATHPATDGEWRFTLEDQAGQALRGWRVTSQTGLGALGATPALVGGDPVVVLDVSRQTKSTFLYEYEVLRLARAGGTSLRFAITPASRAVWGDAPITGVRVGPDGQLYQLRTSPTGGVRVARYALTPARHTPPTPAPAPAPPTPTGPRVDDGAMTAPIPTLPSTQPTTPPADPTTTHSAVGRWLPGLVGVAAATLTGLAMWLLYRRRHPTRQDHSPAPTWPADPPATTHERRIQSAARGPLPRFQHEAQATNGRVGEMVGGVQDLVEK